METILRVNLGSLHFELLIWEKSSEIHQLSKNLNKSVAISSFVQKVIENRIFPILLDLSYVVHSNNLYLQNCVISVVYHSFNFWVKKQKNLNRSTEKFPHFKIPNRKVLIFRRYIQPWAYDWLRLVMTGHDWPCLAKTGHDWPMAMSGYHWLCLTKSWLLKSCFIICFWPRASLSWS